MIHAVKGFSIVNEADAFLEFSCFFYHPTEPFQVFLKCPQAANSATITERNQPSSGRNYTGCKKAFPLSIFWVFIKRIIAEAEASILWPCDTVDSLEKTLILWLKAREGGSRG